MKTKLHILAISLFLILLTACGSGSDHSASPLFVCAQFDVDGDGRWREDRENVRNISMP